jgi:RimJ/RimL family protein N-acetyltransferase
MATAVAAGERWRFSVALARAGEVLRQEGVRSLWFKILGDTVYRRLVLVERPLQDPIPAVTARIPVEISLLQKTQVAEYMAFRPEANEAEVRSQLDAGDWCFVTHHQGQIVSARWATANQVWIDYLSCEFRLAAGEIYSYDLFTKPEFRGHALSPFASAEMLRYFRAAGYRRIVAAISPENSPSLRSVTKTGYRPYGLIGYVKLGPWKRHFCRVRNAPT